MPTFSKSEKLTNHRVIARLFEGQGTAYLAYPVRAVWTTQPEAEAPVQVLISVSKRRFKKATDRNRIKRLMREAWRLHKQQFYQQAEAAQCPPIAILLMYVGKETLPYREVEAGIKKAIRKWEWKAPEQALQL